MSAAPQPATSPKKGPGSESPFPVSANRGFFLVPHSFPLVIARIAQGQCEEFLLNKFLSLVNQRGAWLRGHNLPETGCTGMVSTELIHRLSDDSSEEGDQPLWDVTTIRSAITRLAEIGAIEEIPRASAVRVANRSWGFKGKLLQKADADEWPEGLSDRAAYVIRVHFDRWQALADKRRQILREERAQFKLLLSANRKKLAEAKAAPEVEEEETPEPPKRTRPMPLHRRPLVLVKGKESGFDLDEEAQDEIGLVQKITSRSEAVNPFAVSFTLLNNVLQCVIADAPGVVQEQTKGEGKNGKIRVSAPPESPETPSKTGNLRVSASGIPPSYDSIINSYPVFNQLVMCEFPSTKPKVIADIITACRKAAEEEGKPADWVTDEILLRAAQSRGVTRRGQDFAAAWLRSKGEEGPLVRTVRNWARAAANGSALYAPKAKYGEREIAEARAILRGNLPNASDMDRHWAQHVSRWHLEEFGEELVS